MKMPSTADAKTPTRRSLSDEGSLLCSHGPLLGGKVFYVTRGRRHWVPDAEWLKETGFRFPGDVQTVPEPVLLRFLPGGPVPGRWSLRDWENPPKTNSQIMREIAASQLQGDGVEIGAGASPFPVPLHCRVRYADLRSIEELGEELYPGQEAHDLVPPDLHTALETLAGIADESLDFVIACHVIEHSPDPLGCMSAAFRKLKAGGSLVLVVPDKTRTFDRDRALTTLEHLILDYGNPSPARDAEHFKEFYLKALPVPPDVYERHWREKWQGGYPIHFHCWTFETFGAAVEWALKEIAPFSSVWRQPTLPDPRNLEFYYVLRK